jgi:hypothetical protein
MPLDPLFGFLNIDLRTTPQIDIDTTIPPQNGWVTEIVKNFLIQANAQGGASLTKEV